MTAKCVSCGKALVADERYCSSCGTPASASTAQAFTGAAAITAAPKESGVRGALLGLLLFGGLAWYFFGGGLDKQVASDMQDIHDQVASDAVAQYNIAKQSGSAMDACVHAGLVAAAYIQAQNQPAYQQWKTKEARDCDSAGVPR